MYYPLQYWLKSPWVRSFYKEHIAKGVQFSTAHFSEAAFKAVMPFVQRGKQAGVPFNAESQDLLLVISEEAKGLLSWGQWAANGRRTLEVEPPLALELAHSNPGELTIGDLVERSETLYAHFNLPAGTIGRIDDQYEVEGAYVIIDQEMSIVRVILAGRGQDLNDPVPWQGRYDLRLIPGAFHLPADEAVSLSLQHDLDDIQRARQQARDPSTGPVFEAAKQRMLRNREVYQRAITMLINVMAYRKWEHREVETQWPPGTPPNMAQKWRQAITPKDKLKIEDKLWNMGHSPVQILGKEFVSPTDQAADQSSISRRVHWRSGHWRNQAHGPQMSLRKMVWIRPTVVGASQ